MIAFVIYILLTVLCELAVLLGGIMEDDSDVLLVALLTLIWPAVLATFALAMILNAVYRIFDWIWRKWGKGGDDDEA